MGFEQIFVDEFPQDILALAELMFHNNIAYRFPLKKLKKFTVFSSYLRTYEESQSHSHIIIFPSSNYLPQNPD